MRGQDRGSLTRVPAMFLILQTQDPSGGSRWVQPGGHLRLFPAENLSSPGGHLLSSWHHGLRGLLLEMLIPSHLCLLRLPSFS